jgi:hypothetical protein
MKRLTLLVSALLLGSVLQAGPSDAANLGLQVNPIPASAKVGAAVYLTGTAPAGRTAVMQIQRGTKWVTASAASAPGASFSFKIPTGYYGIRTVRAISPQSGLLGEIDGDAKTMNVLPAYTPTGTASQSITLNNGYRWNPCAPIKYRVNLAGMSKANLKAFRQALARVSLATGFRFSYAGGTKVVPFNHAWSTRVPSGGLYIAFGTGKNVPAMAGIAGLGGEGALVTTSTGAHVVRSGGAVFDKGWWKKLRSGFGGGTSRGSLMLHEIGHAMGLLHVSSQKEIMYPTIGPWTPAGYGRGDLAGLQSLGADQGCVS